MATSPSDPPVLDAPDITLDARRTFGIDLDFEVPAFSRRTDHVPAVDEAYRFNRETTLAILAGFAYNRRVLVQGYHGTGKSNPVPSDRRWTSPGSTRMYRSLNALKIKRTEIELELSSSASD